MSLNLGTPACTAARSLARNPDFLVFRAGLADLVRQKMNVALEASPEHRIDGTAYARALRDLYIAVESAATNTGPNQVEKVSPLKPAKSAGATENV